MIEVGKNSKIHLHWKVSPYDFSKEKENILVAKMSHKYGVPKEHVKVIPDFIMLDDNGDKMSVATEVINNIQNPEFQQKLFKEYLSINDIKDYDFDLIKTIDAEINSKINYELYDKYKRYSIKWVKWNNFLSYGSDNSFDFSNLNGIVLLNGEPANQSGKSTFAIDLIHFLLFGKTEKAATQEKIFNKHLPEATEVTVEGCLTIEGTDYVIKRTLKRPSLSKRSSRSKTVQKVEYYKIVGDTMESLEEFEAENQQAENSIQTNKVIKEAIGNENDFDMIICATSSNLDDLIEKKETDRGRLLSRWIGLLPIEEKDVLAREKFNDSVKKRLYSNMYNSETLQQEIDALNLQNKTLKGEIAKYVRENNSLDKELLEDEEQKKTLLSSKSRIDETLLKVDIVTLNKTLERLIEQGKQKNDELKNVITELENIGEINYSANEFEALQEAKNNLNYNIGVSRERYSSTKKTIDLLTKAEYCPTCGRKYDDIDNSAKIAELNKELEEIADNGKKMATELAEMDKKLEAIKKLREIDNERNKLVVKKSALELSVERLRNDYKDNKNILNEYNKNNEAIDKNNQLDIAIRNIDSKITNKRNTKETNIRYIEKDENTISSNNQLIKQREDIIDILAKEAKIVRNWRLYLDMVGKNGISKLVLRKTLPIINAQMSQLLSDVCDFTVEISITDKNDIMFYLVKDGVRSDLTSGSGFEKTASALALRIVLGNISTLPKLNSLILDEIFARVANDNLENMHQLLNKIVDKYQYVMLITHNDNVKDWAESVVTCSKDANISRLAVSKAK